VKGPTVRRSPIINADRAMRRIEGEAPQGISSPFTHLLCNLGMRGRVNRDVSHCGSGVGLQIS
jgi:hypothetical protein